MTTTIEPSTVSLNGEGHPPTVQARAIQVTALGRGDILTNMGIVDAVTRIGVFVIAEVRGTRWSLGTGKGDVETMEVVWHEATTVSVDQL